MMRNPKSEKLKFKYLNSLLKDIPIHQQKHSLESHKAKFALSGDGSTMIPLVSFFFLILLILRFFLILCVLFIKLTSKEKLL